MNPNTSIDFSSSNTLSPFHLPNLPNNTLPHILLALIDHLQIGNIAMFDAFEDLVNLFQGLACYNCQQASPIIYVRTA